MITPEGKQIVVLGATGRQGGQVVRHLVKHGWPVKALTRTPTGRKAAWLRELGVQVAAADPDDRVSLDSAFANAYGVFNVQVPVAGRIEQEIQRGRNVAAAAQKAGIKHLVYGAAGPGTGGTGVEQWDAKLEVAEAMKSLGLPLTILRPMAFMELMTDPTYYPAAIWYIWPDLTGWERRIPWISVQDVGAIAARVFAEPDEYIGRDLPLAADVKTLRECWDLYTEVMGKAPSRFPMPLFMFEWFAGKDIPNMWRWLGTHTVKTDTSQTYEINPEAMTVKTWLQHVRESGSTSARHLA